MLPFCLLKWKTYRWGLDQNDWHHQSAPALAVVSVVGTCTRTATQPQRCHVKPNDRLLAPYRVRSRTLSMPTVSAGVSFLFLTLPRLMCHRDGKVEQLGCFGTASTLQRDDLWDAFGINFVSNCAGGAVRFHHAARQRRCRFSALLLDWPSFLRFHARLGGRNRRRFRNDSLVAGCFRKQIGENTDTSTAGAVDNRYFRKQINFTLIRARWLRQYLREKVPNSKRRKRDGQWSQPARKWSDHTADGYRWSGRENLSAHWFIRRRRKVPPHANHVVAACCWRHVVLLHRVGCLWRRKEGKFHCRQMQCGRIRCKYDAVVTRSLNCALGWRMKRKHQL